MMKRLRVILISAFLVCLPGMAWAGPDLPDPPDLPDLPDGPDLPDLPDLDDDDDDFVPPGHRKDHPGRKKGR